MKLNILFLICVFAIFTIAYSKKVDKAVFVATKHHTDDEDERVNEDKGTPSCKRKLAKLQTEQKFWQDKLSKVKAKINKKILKLQYKFEHKGKEEIVNIIINLTNISIGIDDVDLGTLFMLY